jgi:hypothetical protein
MRLKLQSLPEAVASEPNQDKASDDDEKMQHVGSDVGNRDRVQKPRYCTEPFKTSLRSRAIFLRRIGTFLNDSFDLIEYLVGAAGFEPTTCSTQNCRATRLRYTPMP